MHIFCKIHLKMRNCSQHSVATFLTTIYRAVFMAFVRTRPKGSFINDVMQRRVSFRHKYCSFGLGHKSVTYVGQKILNVRDVIHECPPIRASLILRLPLEDTSTLIKF